MQNNMSYFSDREVSSERVIYTPSTFAKENLIHLQEIGELTALEQHSSRRQNLDSYLFFLVKKGKGILEYDGTPYELGAGDCVFIDCRKKYMHCSSQTDLWSLQWVHFWGVTMEEIYRKYQERGGKPTFGAKVADVYQNRLQMIFSIADSSDHIRDMRLHEQLSGLLVQLMEETWRPDEHAGVKQLKLQEMKEYIQQHYQEKLSLEILADQFFVNKHYLAKIFRECYGITVNNYIMQIRITRAKQLLRFTDMDMESIGVQCGIEDSNYFARIFKKVEGMTPTKYRKMW